MDLIDVGVDLKLSKIVSFIKVRRLGMRMLEVDTRQFSVAIKN